MSKLLDAFIDLGYRFESKRLRGESLSREDRMLADKLQKQATKDGLSQSLRNSCIIEGEAQARSEVYKGKRYA